MTQSIYPVFDKIIPRSEKEQKLEQRARVLWMTGLSGAGKTTLATALEQRLFAEGFLTQILDGDNIRSGINNNLGFSLADRMENVRRIAEVSKLFLNCGIITISCFISPTDEIRELARSVIGVEDFIEIFINTPLAVCEQRDPKGLYKKARSGELKQFTGIDSPFEEPQHPFIDLRTEHRSIDECVDELFIKLLPLISYAQ